MASASTPYGGGLPERAHNIELAANLLNGTVIMPGQTFSFNAEIGDMTVNAGFQIAYGIATENGQTLRPSLPKLAASARSRRPSSSPSSGRLPDRPARLARLLDSALRLQRHGRSGRNGRADRRPGLQVDQQHRHGGHAGDLRRRRELHGAALRHDPNWRSRSTSRSSATRSPPTRRSSTSRSDTIPVGSTRPIEHAQDGFDVSVTRRVFEGDQVREEGSAASYAPARNVVLVGSADR